MQRLENKPALRNIHWGKKFLLNPFKCFFEELHWVYVKVSFRCSKHQRGWQWCWCISRELSGDVLLFWTGTSLQGCVNNQRLASFSFRACFVCLVWTAKCFEFNLEETIKEKVVVGVMGYNVSNSWNESEGEKAISFPQLNSPPIGEEKLDDLVTRVMRSFSQINSPLWNGVCVCAVIHSSSEMLNTHRWIKKAFYYPSDNHYRHNLTSQTDIIFHFTQVQIPLCKQILVNDHAS